MGNVCKICGKDSGSFTICDECKRNLYCEQLQQQNTCKICGKQTQNPKLCDDCLADILRDYKGNSQIGESELRDEKSETSPINNTTYKRVDPPKDNFDSNVSESTNIVARQDVPNSSRICESCGNSIFRSEIVIIKGFSLKRFFLILLVALLVAIASVLTFIYSDIFQIGIVLMLISFLIAIFSLTSFRTPKKYKKLVCTKCGHIQD